MTARLVRAMLAAAALVVAIGAVPAAMAQTARWRVMTEMGTPPDLELLLIDMPTLSSPTPSTRTLTVASYRARPKNATSGKPFDMIRITYAFDCEARTTQRTDVFLYLGSELINGGPTEGPVKPVEAGTLPGELFEPACGGDFSAYEPITAATPEAERDRRFGITREP